LRQLEEGWPKMLSTDFGYWLFKGRVRQGCGELAQAAVRHQTRDTGAGGDHGIAKMWNHREISVSP
jgi:hypothetical protein